MDASANLDIICERVTDTYFRVYGDAVEAVFLYGSYARGDFSEDSDLDFVAIVKGERLNLQQKLGYVLDDTVKMDLEYDVISSPNVIPTDEFRKYQDELPYYRNILKEGKRIDRFGKV